MNPKAIVFWSFCAGVGYLIGQDLYSVVIGCVVGLGLSLVVDILSQ